MDRPRPSGAPPCPRDEISPETRRFLAVMLALFVLGLAGYAAVAVGGERIFSADAVRDAALVLGAVVGLMCLARPILVARDRVPWALIGCGLALYAFTDGFWALAGEPVLSVADAGYELGNLLLWAGLVALLRNHVTRSGVVLVLDAAGVGLAVVALGVAVLMPAVAGGMGGSGLSVAVNVSYPMWDVVLVASALAVVAATSWRPGRDALAILAGLGLALAADTLYLTGLAYSGPVRNLDTVFWLAGYLLIAVAGWLTPRDAREPTPVAWRVMAVPWFQGAVALGVLVTGGFVRVEPAAVVLAALALVTVLVRMWLQFLDTRALGRDLEAAERLAARDPLTGLLNHRAFHERLAEESARAERAEQPLSVVLIDIDHFKVVNDTHGHQAGDAVLVEVAQRLSSVIRHGDVLARIGGEEFAWLLPGADDLTAWDAAERARHVVRSEPIHPVERVTVSGGVSDTRHARSSSELVTLADGALYWAKAHGRDVIFRYSTEVVRALSAEERAAQLTRAQALNAMRVLARAVDARDPYTAAHSERVADMCVRLATVLGWSSHRIVALREAALVHDVGKIGVSDAVLLKPMHLDEDERREIEEHAALGAQIVADVLTDEQASWVRGHHERFDGAGYPDGLCGDAVPDGARILAVADAWDAMTTDRPYRAALTLEIALPRITAGAGVQFHPEVVDALVVLADARALDPVAVA